MRKLLIILTAIMLCLGGTAEARRTSGKVRQQQKQTEKQIRQTEAQIKETNRKITTAINDLNKLNIEIEDCNTRITRLNQRIDSIETDKAVVADSVQKLDERLQKMRQSLASVLLESRRSRSSMGNLAFIFSSESFVQAYRRVRALKQFSKWRTRKAGEISQVKEILDQRRQHLQKLEEQSNDALRQLSAHKVQLQAKQGETDRIVGELRGKERQLKKVMDKQQATARELDNELDRIIAQEKKEAEEKARREAEEKARKEAEERARREAEEKARLEAEAKAKAEAEEKERIEAEEKARQEAAEKANAKTDDAKATADKQKADAKKTKASKAKADNGSKGSDSPRSDRKKVGGKKQKAKKQTDESLAMTGTGTSSAAASGASPGASAPSAAETARQNLATFAENKGKLPYPVSQPYSIVKRFGRQKHPSLPYVETDNSGIDIQTSSGAPVRCVFDGEVSAIFCPDGYNNVVVVRHGDYVTVYANLGTLSVRKGDKVKRSQQLGTVYVDTADSDRSILHFEIRNATSASNIIKENPEIWLR